MQMIILFLLIHVIPVTFEYELRCPVSSEWRFRARKLNCSSSQYVCLFHSHKKRYYETCDGLDYSSTGSKLIFEPFFNKAECTYKRYQPFPFSTDGSSDCVYQKSVCNEHGQYVFRKGISKNDTTCGCNFSKGYTFITKPRHFCYCIPSEEDCSCYRHSCSFKEIKCSQDGAADLNKTCPEIINMPSHENEMGTPMTNDKTHENKGRHNPVQLICLTTILLIIICIAVLVYVMINEQESVEGMDNSENNRYRKAIAFGKEVRKYVRIIVIGEHGAGKSTLVRRLLNQDIDGIDSTDGIEMNNKFQIRERDGQWVFDKGETDIDNIIKRVRQAADRNPDKLNFIAEHHENFNNIESNQNSHRDPENPVHDKPDSIKEQATLTEMNQYGQEPIKSKQPYDKSEQKEPSSLLSIKEEITTEQIVKEDSIMTNHTYEEIQNTDTTETGENKSDRMLQLYAPPLEDQTLNITDKLIESDEKMDAVLLKAKNMNENLISEGFIQCGIWDFAGEKDYYVTHQTFLTHNAIYLIVADVNKDIKTLDMIEKEKYFDSIGGYIDFWFDSIHCFCEDNSTDGCKQLDPPILMVLTHTDKCNQVEARIGKYDDDFTKIIGSQRKSKHNRGIHFISNTNNFQADILKLREDIVKIARETDFSAQELPTEWIHLEHFLAILRENNEITMSWEMMNKIAKRTSFKDENQLVDFLTYQTKIGNILFFNDVRDYIILKPEWLAKCFRCLVFNDKPREKNKNMLQTSDWFDLASEGKLTTSIINTLFEKERILEVQKKEFLLKVMEKFDVIIKPKVRDSTTGNVESDSYYMPCMIKTDTPSLRDIEKTFIDPENSRFSKSPWLIFEFEFLPLAYFNHILINYIRNYNVCICPQNGNISIYRGKAVFFINKKMQFSQLIVCFSKNTVSLQIWRWEEVEDKTYRTILEELCDIIKKLNRKLSKNLHFDIKAKCPDGDHYDSSDAISIEELENLGTDKLYRCETHKERHRTDELENTWLRHVKSVVEEYNKDEKNDNYHQDENTLEEYEYYEVGKSLNNAQDEDQTFRMSTIVCPECTAENPSNTQQCGMCYQHLHNPEWRCQSNDCFYQNPDSESKCSRCKKYRTHSADNRLETIKTRLVEAKWTKIVLNCKQDKINFTDKEFPPTDYSLFKNPPYGGSNIKWLRLKDVKDVEGKGPIDWKVYDKPTANDIIQGKIGNRLFIYALAVVADRQKLLERIVVTKDYCHEGAYVVRLCKDGIWKTVVLDDYFPVDQYKRLKYSEARRGQLWVPLIEKAAAKIHGCYQALGAGRTVEYLSWLTGEPCEHLSLNDNIDFSKTIDNMLIWSRLTHARDCRYLMCTSCEVKDGFTQDYCKSLGLITGHAYSLLDVYDIDTGEKLLKIRNLWGSDSWKGDWSDSSPKWQKVKPEVKQKLKPDGNKHGTFWMEFKDFRKHFGDVDICKTRDWYETRIKGSFPSSADGPWKFVKVYVQNKTDLCIGLHQKNKRGSSSNDDLVDMLIVAMEIVDGKKLSSVGHSKRDIKSYVGCEIEHLERGEYTIACLAFKHLDGGKHGSHVQRDFVLTIHSTQNIVVEENDSVTAGYKHFLADTLIQLAVDEGNQQSLKETKAYKYSLALDGIILIIENKDVKEYLSIQEDCRNTRNLMSTRGSMFTQDIIPPGHRQLIFLLTRIDNRAGYSYQSSSSYNSSNAQMLKHYGGNTKNHKPEISSELECLHIPRPI